MPSAATWMDLEIITTCELSQAEKDKYYMILLMLCLVTQSVWLCDLMDCSPSGPSVHGDSPGKNTGVGCHSLFQGIFLTLGLNPGLLHCRRILYCLSHQGSPKYSISLIKSILFMLTHTYLYKLYITSYTYNDLYIIIIYCIFHVIKCLLYFI